MCTAPAHLWLAMAPVNLKCCRAGDKVQWSASSIEKVLTTLSALSSTTSRIEAASGCHIHTASSSPGVQAEHPEVSADVLGCSIHLGLTQFYIGFNLQLLQHHYYQLFACILCGTTELGFMPSRQGIKCCRISAFTGAYSSHQQITLAAGCHSDPC